MTSYEQLLDYCSLHFYSRPEFTVTTEERYQDDKIAIDAFRGKYCINDTEKEFPAYAILRVAAYIASAEIDDGNSIKEAYDLMVTFFEMMWKFEIVAGGRIMIGAGNPSKVSLINCTSVEIKEDSLEGIWEADYQIGKVESRGEGVGTDITKLRPKGFAVNNAAKSTSGAISWMAKFDATTGTVSQMGRRGALLISINISHPEAIDFIKVKSDLKLIQNANISLRITDDFMQAVIDDADWEFFWVDEHGKKIVGETNKARDIMRMLSEHSSKYAEPGLQFWDTISRSSNSDALGFKVTGTNACLPGDTEILTDKGYIPIEVLVDEKVNVWNGSEFSEVKPKITGYDQPIYRVTLSSGQYLDCTPNHEFYVYSNGVPPYKGGIPCKVKVSDLKIGTPLVKVDLPVIEYGIYEPNAYTQGFISAEGSDGYNSLWVYEPKYMCVDRLLLRRMSDKDEQRKRRSVYPTNRPLPKSFVPFGWNVESRLDWLAGLFDGDGTVLNEGGIQLGSVDRIFLKNVQKLLTTLGVHSKINISNPPGLRSMPDGHGGMKDFMCQQAYRLCICSQDVQNLVNLGIEFSRLQVDFKPNRNASRFVTVVSVEDLEYSADKVYCFTEPLRGLGCFEGIVTGQCSEQPLTHLDSCVLGHANWATLPLDLESAGREVHKRAYYLAWFLDGVVTKQLVDKRSPLPESAEKSALLRRIGAGYTGLADYFATVGVTYASPESIALAENLASNHLRGAYARSMQAGKEKGSFPAFDSGKINNSAFISAMQTELVLPEKITHLRNVCNITVAPVGTGMLMVLGWANGAEPGLGYAYWRRTRISGEYVWYFVVNPFVYKLIKDPAIADVIKALADRINRLPIGGERFTSEDAVFKLLEGQIDGIHKFSHEVDPMDKVKLIGILQKYNDSSISVTFNMPQSTTVEQIEELYIEGWKQGLKGLSIYREDPENRPPIFQFSRPTTFNYTRPEGLLELASESGKRIGNYRARPQALSGYTETVKAEGDKFYFTYNLDGENSLYEVFTTTNVREPKANTEKALASLTNMLNRSGIDSKYIDDQIHKSSRQHSTVRVCRLVSLGLRNSVPIDTIIQALDEVEVTVSSYIFHLRRGLAKFKGTKVEECPECGDNAMVVGGGCNQCASCGYSKC